eukprot:152194_1
MWFRKPTKLYKITTLLRILLTAMVFIVFMQFILLDFVDESAESETLDKNISFSEISSEEILNQFVNPPYPIDIVITWAGETKTSNPRQRYNGELKYCLRSIFENIAWFNYIYIIVNNETYYNIIQNNTFINPKQANIHRVKFISLLKIFRNESNAINQHNSDAIETNLHRIPHLADHYIYFNDDFFIGKKLSWNFFFILDKNRLIPRMPYIVYIAYTFGSSWWNIFRFDSIDSIISPYVSTLPCLNDSGPIKSYEIPFGNKKSMMRHYMEHMPRPYFKNDWMQFEFEYPALFRFIESKKERLINCKNKDVSIIKHYTRKLLNGDFKINIMYFKYYDYVYSFLIQYYRDYIIERNYYHFFLFGNKVYDLKRLKYYLAQLLHAKPFTFNINDYFPRNNTDHRKQLNYFFQRYFPQMTPFEK